MKKKMVMLLLVMSVLASCLNGCGSSAESADMSVATGAETESGIVYEEAAEGEMFVAESPAEAMTDMAMDGMKVSATSRYSGDTAGIEFNTEEYNSIEEQGFVAVATKPLSTFSADVDTASYANVRRMIYDGYTMEDIPQGAVRIEEFLNYFTYDYDLPKQGEPFGVTTEIADCPWNEETKLMMIGLKTEEIDFSEAPASNLVFLLDVSGSMNSSDKLPLLQKSFTLLTENLTEKDRVSIVVYAGEDAVILEGAHGDEKEKIIEALEELQAGGSTAGSKGIETAYKLAEENFIEGGNNRVILATDGDLNVGMTSESELEELISEKKESGVFLSVLGFGTGNLKDNKMEVLADKGNGTYAYIDSLGEAKKVLVEEMGATLVTVAKDVKFQVEFNPAVVKGYRLVGYENRVMADEDFADDTKDAGEIGAGHSVTVLYEIVTNDSTMDIAETELKYQATEIKNEIRDLPAVKEWLTISVRYKEPEGEESKLLDYPVGDSAYTEAPSEDFQFASAVAQFAMLLRESEYVGESTVEDVLEQLKELELEDDMHKEELYFLVKYIMKNS